MTDQTREEMVARIITGAFGLRYDVSRNGDMSLETLDAHRAARAILAALAPAPDALGEGWVAVPREPTEAMRDAIWRAVQADMRRADVPEVPPVAAWIQPKKLYRAMIAAAPPLPLVGGEGKEGSCGDEHSAETGVASQLLGGEQRFFLSTDGDSHWYLVPEANRAEWQEWADLDGDDERAWEPPAYAKRLGGGPQGITFTNPQGLL